MSGDTGFLELRTPTDRCFPYSGSETAGTGSALGTKSHVGA
jgi:hypothetical protein